MARDIWECAHYLAAALGLPVKLHGRDHVAGNRQKCVDSQFAALESFERGQALRAQALKIIAFPSQGQDSGAAQATSDS